MILRKLSQSLQVTLALMVSVFSSGLMQPAVAYATPANTLGSKTEKVDTDGDGIEDDKDECPETVSGASVNSKGCEEDDTTGGNNGTIKIHESTDPAGTESNNPKVCSFNIEGFGFDEGQTGYITFEVQGGDEPTGTAAGPFDVGPADSEGNFATEYFDLEDGHYKATLFDDEDNEKAKSKVFKVDCDDEVLTPANPLVMTEVQLCTEGDVTSDVEVTVTNQVDDTEASQAYTVTIGSGATAQTQTTDILEDGDSETLVFSGLSAGEYTAAVSGTTDETTATSESFTVINCDTDEPEAATPSVTATAQACKPGDVTKDILVSVTNTDDDTDETVTYEITIDDEDMTTAPVEDGETGSVTFKGLPAGTYDVEVLGSDDTTTSTTVTVAECGGRGGEAPCVVSNNSYFAPWTYDGDTYPEADDYTSGSQTVTNNGTFTFKSNGLYLSTPGNPDYVFGLTDAGSTKFSDVNAMGYMTLRELTSTGASHLVPSYVLYVDLNGSAPGGEDYLIYEPVYTEGAGAIQTGVWQTWDAYKNGSAKFWSPNNPDAFIEWSVWVQNNPNAVVLAYGFNQGTGNPGLNAAIQSLKFDCATTTFGNAPVLSDNDVCPNLDGSQTTVPNGYTKDSTGNCVTPGRGGDTPPTPGQTLGTSTTTGGQTLGTSVLPAMIPATGENDSPFMIIVAAILAYGAAYFLQGRRLLGRKEALSA